MNVNGPDLRKEQTKILKTVKTTHTHTHTHIYIYIYIYIYIGGRPCGVVANVLDNDILENEFELQCLIFNFLNNLREILEFAKYTKIFEQKYLSLC